MGNDQYGSVVPAVDSELYQSKPLEPWSLTVIDSREPCKCPRPTLPA